MNSPIRFLVACALATSACQQRETPADEQAVVTKQAQTPANEQAVVTKQAQTATDEQTVITKRASEVLSALQGKDMSRLAPLVHPSLGVRFSPYPHVLATDRKFTRDEVTALWNETKTYDWGAADGTGDPI